DIMFYQNFNIFLQSKNLRTKNINNCKNIQDFLEIYESFYLTKGLMSLKKLPDRSIDFIFSHAVLEHIRKKDFLKTIKEIRRIIKNTGYCSHQIDLTDHLGGNLNNLRFSEPLWESDFMVKSGFYTNRICYSEILELFKKCDFKIEDVQKVVWDKLPISRSKLSPEFRNRLEEDILISGFSVKLNPNLN
ncbi:MAG: methyltransferase domain-containing protein, partial [Jaaginema sp. PMC 1080.18]|nr:methyltransferase domain-containing protein [Jaaginema sp. PMC 1080.18]